jgi:ABC-2 type transport system ATP-binding protein
MSEPAIRVERLVKRYGDRLAVNELSLTVEPGELLAMLGPNGAGKTTTVETLEGYRRADSGEVRVLGLDPIHDAGRLKPRIGIMLQQGGLYPSAAPRETLRLYARFFQNPRNPDALLQQVGLESAARTRYRRLSGGQRQRLSLALALVGRPELLFLDEPTAALDPQARHATWELIREQRRQGVTIVLTTHFMDEAEQLADRVAIVDHGRLVALDTPRALIDSTAAARAGPADATSALRFSTAPGLDRAQLSALLDGAEVSERPPGHYLARTSPTPRQLARLAGWLADRDLLLTELTTGYGTLEAAFLALTGRELRE